MADLTITIPDDQIATMEKHLDPAGETGADAQQKQQTFRLRYNKLLATGFGMLQSKQQQMPLLIQVSKGKVYKWKKKQ